MAFQKNKTTASGIVAGYWCLIKAELRALPAGSATSTVTYGLFASHDIYNTGAQPLETVAFELSYSDALNIAYPILPNVEAYIKAIPAKQIGIDPVTKAPVMQANFFADALTAPE